MNSITFSTSEMWKAAILPSETGIYKASKSGATSFYVIVEDSSLDDIRVKWLGSNGFYKHGTFLKWTTEKQNAKEGFLVEVYNTSLSEAKARRSLVSKTNQRTLTLIKKAVEREIYDLYLDLAKSPKVYLNVGDWLNDKWIEVTVKWQPIKIERKTLHDITIEVEMPEDFIQKL